MKIEWSKEAIDDLDRFAEFLQSRFPKLAPVVGEAIIERVATLSAHPHLGRPITGNGGYRQAVMRVLNAAYVVQYRLSGDRIVILRVYHGRERR